MENKDEKGVKTKGLAFINAMQLIVCIIMAIVNCLDDELVIGFIFLISGIVACFFIKGFADIIDLLDSINNKLDKE